MSFDQHPKDGEADVRSVFHPLPRTTLERYLTHLHEQGVTKFSVEFAAEELLVTPLEFTEAQKQECRPRRFRVMGNVVTMM